MSVPRIELIPGRPAVGRDASVMLNVLVRITPPQPEVHFPRPKINLALVLDRSGSMQGAKKMPYARDAAIFAIEQLLPEDRASVTFFDNEIETVVPNAPVVDKTSIRTLIKRVEPRGMTDLHGGWAEGVKQAEFNLVEGGLNRVMLLTDGLANVGVVDPGTIAQAARGAAARGVGTTTLGLGADYNEDLLEAMAKAGDGNYYYIESPVQLADLFQTELHGLMATTGQKVSLGLEPIDGVMIIDTLNDFERAPTGRFRLPNLIVGMPISVVVTLKIPAQPAAISPMAVRLAWDNPRNGVRHVLNARIDPLNPIRLAEWDALAVDSEVAEAAALLMVARAQKEAGLALQRGDRAASAGWLGQSLAMLAEMPSSPAIADEMVATRAMQAAWDEGNDMHTQKQAKARAYGRHKGYSPMSAPTPPKPEDDPKAT